MANSPLLWNGSAAKFLRSQLIIPGSTSGNLTLQPSASTTSYTLTMPAAQGAASSLFQNDGSGNLSFITTLSVAQTTIAAQAISSTSIDWSTGSLFTKTLGANTTFTFTGQVSGQTIVVRLTNTVSNYTVTWPSVKWANGTPPTMSTGAVSDIYTFIYDGSNVYGSAVQNMS